MHTVRIIVTLLICVATTSSITAQYTETINSNRPGESQGAFSVGTRVLQVETGFDIGNDTHSLLQTDTDILGYNLNLRYGLFFEKLELNGFMRYQRNEVSFISGSATPDVIAGLETVQIGAKYLIYDPYKYASDEVNLYSYHANRRFKWKSLIPAVTVYAGGVFDFENSQFNSIREDGISPNLALILQHNWGRWVWVNNIIVDRAGTTYPTNSWITTLTHSFNSKFAGFAEYQLIDGDLYADYLVRAGAAYLITKNLQVDLSGLANFKDTPTRWNVSAGVSYRLDLHEKDEIIKDRDADGDKKSSSKRQAERINKNRKRKDAVDPDGDGIK
ncbi:transporter [uncultured Dokdonia sp.]|uniref:transporter n=1 Tax=Dokdonia sp. Asnod2-E02 TaxID=3160574 RepID=UPI002624D35E|nr:transporter [uncultured Dokdonia sp.]